jgi:hypothetical protein
MAQISFGFSLEEVVVMPDQYMGRVKGMTTSKKGKEVLVAYDYRGYYEEKWFKEEEIKKPTRKTLYDTAHPLYRKGSFCNDEGPY